MSISNNQNFLSEIVLILYIVLIKKINNIFYKWKFKIFFLIKKNK